MVEMGKNGMGEHLRRHLHRESHCRAREKPDTRKIPRRNSFVDLCQYLFLYLCALIIIDLQHMFKMQWL